MRIQSYKIGQPVVYRRFKHSARPGVRADNVVPEPLGEGYTYEVDKYWVIQEVRDETVLLRTRRGKAHEVQMHDPRLRRASFMERLFKGKRFPRLDDLPPVKESRADRLGRV